jgi:hypothetical protein
MRVEVTVHAEGEGPAPLPALDVFRQIVGDTCVSTSGIRDRWSVRLVLDAPTLKEALAAGVAITQAASPLAGLPDWPIRHADALGPKEGNRGFRRRRVLGASMGGSYSSGDDESGVREPVRPRPSPPTLKAERSE